MRVKKRRLKLRLKSLQLNLRKKPNYALVHG
jgi:hypothetical protein